MSLLDDARSMSDDLVHLQRCLHREPEIGLDLPRTQERVLAALAGLPLEITTGCGASSVTAVLRGTAPAPSAPLHPDPAAANARPPAVLLRGDMDALAVQERTGLDHASTTDGAMHACGHDLHTAMLVGAAHLLSAHHDRLPGDVVFMFQPGEEGWEGAQQMIDEGVLDASGRRVSAAYGLHVFSAELPHGQFCGRTGAITSASAMLRVTVRGEGGHGSMPHRAHGPITAAAEMILALQTMVTRQFDVFDPVVLTVGVLRAGTRRTIIPDEAYFEATVRTFSTRTGDQIEQATRRLLQGIADGHNIEADIEFVPERPATINHPAETALAARTVAETFGERRYSELTHPLACSEDFSRVLAQVPGTFIAIGAGTPDSDPHTEPFNHSPRARFDETVLPDGAALYAELALRALDLAAASPDPTDRRGAPE
ncbi:M20 metallopeptidase family protein [Candidatus Frankia alpina]|uniref:Amidohydrolase n=1 Tax=Candidatus Frankia alpina TaxID=2699483 RepID=A0A4V3Z7U8_9ACTN|nr:M20 family metallopeptidase [Candidatus Frankia alpina]THJ75559.1 amidohydrolase [Candidatus Frankia alpina]